jgi:hypothetical protein
MMIDSIPLLRGALYKVFKHRDIAEMMDVFISGECSRYWIYNLTLEDGTITPFIDYSLQDGGGWLNTGCSYADFVAAVDVIISTWPLSEDIKTILENEKSRLAKLMQESISNSKPNSLPKEAK